jgi:hypothetical protein
MADSLHVRWECSISATYFKVLELCTVLDLAGNTWLSLEAIVFVECEIVIMTPAQKLSLAFDSMHVTNDPLALGMLNLVRRRFIIAPTQLYIYCDEFAQSSARQRLSKHVPTRSNIVMDPMWSAPRSSNTSITRQRRRKYAFATIEEALCCVCPCRGYISSLFIARR